MATIKVEVIGDSRKFRSDLANVESATGRAGGGLSKFAKIAAGAGAVLAGGMVVGLKKSLDAAGDFQSKMAVLQATTHGTNAQMAAASKLAIKLGADARLPAVSAGDAADAMLQLGKAGFSVQKSMAAARGTLLLATAAETDGATAAKVVTQNLNAFGLKAKDTSKIVDEMAGFMNATGTAFDAFADSLTYTAAISHTVGQSFADTTTQLTILSQAGIEGSQAGTGLRTILAGLGAEGSKASKTFKEVGVDTVDSNGKFIGMRATIEKLTPVFAKMTSSQRLTFLQTAFGKTAMNQANIVLSESIKKYDAAKAAVERKGQADKLAASHMTGYKGAVAQLGSALETLEITMGTKFLPVATKVANFLTNIASAPSLSVAIHIALSGIKSIAVDLWKQISDALTGDSTKHILIGSSVIGFRSDGQGLASKFWDWFVVQVGPTPTKTVVVGGSVVSFKKDPTLRDRFTAWISDEASKIDWSSIAQDVVIGVPRMLGTIAIAFGNVLADGVTFGIKHANFGDAKTAILDVGKLIAGASLQWARFFGAPFIVLWDRLGSQLFTGGVHLAERLAAGVKTIGAKLVGFAGDMWDKISSAISQVAGQAFGAAKSIGGQLVGGIVQGIKDAPANIGSSLWGAVKGGVSWAGDRAHGSGPWQFTIHEVGEPLVMGIIQGIANKTPSLRQQILTSVRSAVSDAKSNATSAASDLGSTIGNAIQASYASKIASIMNGPTGQALAALTDKINAKQSAEQLAGLQQSLADAQAGSTDSTTGVVTVDPRAVQSAIQALDDWKDQQQQQTLQAQLAKAQTEIQAEADARSTAFQSGITNLQDSLNRGLISQGTYNKELQQLLGDSGQSYYSIGKLLGSSTANGFRDEIKALAGDVSTILSQNIAITIGKKVTAGAIAVGGTKGFHGFASGGIVKGGRGGLMGMIGEGSHDELITPLPNGGLGGGVTVNIYAQNLVSTKEELFEEARNWMIRTGRRGTGGVLGGN